MVIPHYFQEVEVTKTYTIYKCPEEKSLEEANLELQGLQFAKIDILFQSRCFRTVTPEQLKRQEQEWALGKANMSFDDEIVNLNDFCLIHTTTIDNWDKISKCGQILSRNGAGVIPVISDLGDGDCIFTSVLRHEALKELKKQTSQDKVLIVLDPKLLLRQDYYISSGWSYGPFKERYRRFEMGYERYFRPELRNDIRFMKEIAPSEVIPSIKTFLHDDRFGADIDRGINEVGFLNPINLKDSLIEVFP